MSTAPTPSDLRQLAAALEGDLHTDRVRRTLYATDASEYQETPLAVAVPRSEADLRALLAHGAIGAATGAWLEARPALVRALST